MDINLSLSKTGQINLAATDLVEQLGDIEKTLSYFPKLETLTNLDGQRYRWDLAAIGAAGIEHEVSFATDFMVDTAANTITFTAVPGIGNAEISGKFTATEQGQGSELRLDISGTLADIKVPMLLRGPAKPFIKGMFESLVNRFVERIESRYKAT